MKYNILFAKSWTENGVAKSYKSDNLNCIFEDNLGYPLYRFLLPDVWDQVLQRASEKTFVYRCEVNSQTFTNFKLCASRVSSIIS